MHLQETILVGIFHCMSLLISSLSVKNLILKKRTALAAAMRFMLLPHLISFRSYVLSCRYRYA